MTTTTSVGAGIWTADLTRTRAAFAARHLFGQTVQGTIAVTGGTLHVGPDGQPRRFQATLDPASIGTGHEQLEALRWRCREDRTVTRGIAQAPVRLCRECARRGTLPAICRGCWGNYLRLCLRP